MTAKRSKPADRNSHIIENEAALCQFPFADGRRCRMLRSSRHPVLCPFHARAERRLLESRRLGTQIASTITGEFLTATDINFVLGKLFTALAQNRIPRRDAATLAFIGQVMLQSIPTSHKEFGFHYTFEKWQKMIAKAVPLSDPSQSALLADHSGDFSLVGASDVTSANSSGESLSEDPCSAFD